MHTHTQVPTYAHKCTHVGAQICMDAHTHGCADAHECTHTHMHILKDVQMCARKCTHADACRDTDALTRMYTRACAPTVAHVWMHTFSCMHTHKNEHTHATPLHTPGCTGTHTDACRHGCTQQCTYMTAHILADAHMLVCTHTCLLTGILGCPAST